MTPETAKAANTIERVALFVFKLIAGAVLCAIVAALLVVLCIGVQEVPNRYEKAMNQFEQHQILNEKFKATSLNE